MGGSLGTLVTLWRLIAERIDDRRLRRALRAAPLWPLADLPEDVWARITGVARPLDERVLEAPLSGRLCLYYSITLEEHGPGGVAVLASEQEAVPFVLEDRGSRAVIDPAHARISSGFDHRSESLAAFDASPRQRALLERHGLVYRNWYSTEKLRYAEAIIELDEAITVVGAGTREPDPDAPATGAYRDARPTRIRLTGSARYPLMISDDPRSL